MANFWPASQQQIYRELDRIHREGLLEATLIKQEKSPNKRIFRLNDSGREELADFIRTETGPAAVRDDLLVKVVALGPGNREDVAAAIHHRRALSTEKLALYERLRESLLGDLTEEQYLAEEDGFGLYFALKRGLSFERENLRWYSEVLAAIGAHL